MNRYTPLYVGLTTGLCGSITSFSSWMGDTFQAFAQIGTPSHGGFYNVRTDFSGRNALCPANVTHPQFMDGLGISIVTLGASSAAFVLGTQVGPYILHPTALHFIARWIRFNRYGRFSEQRTGHSSEKQAMTLENGPLNDGHASEFRPNGKTNGDRRASQHSHTIAAENLKANYPAWLQLQLVLLFLLMWLATILISIYVSKWRGIVMFALVLSPVGVWLRFELSQLNIKHPSFPLGTFLANQIGTAVLALLVALQFTPDKTLLQCQIMQGLLDGFCGTLTTVSTFIVELKKLERRSAYVYALASWMVGQILMLVILGSVDFARGGLLEAKCAI